MRRRMLLLKAIGRVKRKLSAAKYALRVVAAIGVASVVVFRLIVRTGGRRSVTGCTSEEHEKKSRASSDQGPFPRSDGYEWFRPDNGTPGYGWVLPGPADGAQKHPRMGDG